MLFKGAIKPQVPLGLSNIGYLAVSEAWIAASDHPATGTYYRVTDDSPPCIFYPCPAYHEAPLNGNRWGYIDDVDLTPAAFVREGRHGNAPALVEVTDQLVFGHADIFKKHFIKLRPPVICRSGLTVTPGLCISTSR